MIAISDYLYETITGGTAGGTANTITCPHVGHTVYEPSYLYNIFDVSDNQKIVKRIKQVHNHIGLRILKNAIKATETMIAIGKDYVSLLRTIFIAIKNYIKRMMCCMSGHLSWRLRRLIRSS